jgi:hypothetical protein
MTTSTGLPVGVRGRGRSLRAAALAALALGIACGPRIAGAQCALSSPVTWNVAGSGDWSTAGDWSGGSVPDSYTTNVCITNGTSVVTISSGTEEVASLQIGSGNGLTVSSATLSVAGPSIVNDGTITLANGGSNLQLVGNVTLSGTGTLNLVDGQIGTNNTNYTLTNQSTITGYGLIGSNSGSDYPPVNFVNSGTLNANSSGNTLTIAGSGPTMTNSGTLEATGGGILTIASNPMSNAGGTILSGSSSTVNISTTIEGGTLQTTGSGVLQTSGSATLDGSTLGAMTLTNGTTYTGGASTTTSVLGTLNLGSSGAGATLAIAGNLRLINNTTLAGTGSVTLSGGQIGTNNTNYTLTNGSSITIQGYGLIGSDAGSDYPPLNLVNNGTVNANSVGNTLGIAGSGTTITNAGVFEATGGGTLTISPSSASIGNQAGTILASGSGSTVNIEADIVGGTLTTTGGGVMQTLSGATLDGSTDGAITLTNGTTYLAPTNTTTSVLGTLNLGSSGSGATLEVVSNTTSTGNLRLIGNTTLAGTGTLLLMGGQIGTNNTNYTLTNGSTNTIQGYGVIGSDAGSDYPPLSLVNNGVINANVSGSGNSLTIGGSGASIVNNNLLEATDGGTLILNTNAALSNASGTILANGAAVQLVNETVVGGTLTTENGGTMQTGGASGGNAYLNGTTSGQITLTDGSSYTAGAAGSSTTTQISGALALGTTSGSTLVLGGALELLGNTTLSGPGKVTMTSGQIGTNNNNYLLTNDVTIQGSGTIGSNNTDYSTMSLTNSGVIDANVSGQTLAIQETNGTNTNTGTLEATDGGTLSLATNELINNQGGVILASGAGSTVTVATTIDGGTLSTTGGAVMQSATNNSAYLNGASASGAITFADGTTYTAGAAGTNQITYVNGSLILGSSSGSNIALGGALELLGNTTLSGPGRVTMTSGQIGTNNNDYTLTNETTIQGSGLIGSSDATYSTMTVANQGLINGNVNGATLQIGNTSGNLTNTGTLEASNGGRLLVTTGLANFSGNTLTNGTYIVDGTGAGPATMEIALGSNGGGEIVNNAANIILNGTNPNVSFVDTNGHAALALAANTTASSSLTIEGGYTLTTPGAFANAGSVTIGAGSTLQAGTGTSNYSQSGGLTQGNGALVAGNVAINGGAINPGLGAAPGTLTVTASYTQGSGGVFNENIASATSFGVLNVSGGANVSGAAGTLNIVSSAAVQNGSAPIEVGQTLTILTSSGLTNGFTNASITGNTTFDNGLEAWKVSSPNGKNEVLLASAVGPVTATWTGPSGDWTANSGSPDFTTNWSCNVAIFGGCVPNNNAAASYDAVLNSAGNTLALNSGDTVTVSSLDVPNGQVTANAGSSLTAGTTTVGSSVDDVIESNGGAVNLGTLTNLSGGTLSGGGYQAGGTTAGTIVINGNVTTIGANTTVQLDQAGSKLSNGSGDALAGLANVNGGFFQVYDGASESITPAGGTLTTNAGTVNISFGGSSLTVNGALANTNGSSVNTNAGNINVTGNVSNDASSSITASGGGSITAGSMSNAGTVLADTGSTITSTGAYTQSGGTTTANGTLSAGSIAINGGTLTGGTTATPGVVNGATTIGSGGTLLAGTAAGAPGTLHFGSSLTINGTLGINATSSTAYGVIDVSGALTLNGSSSVLNLSSLDALNLGIGTTLTIATAGTAVAGAFASVTGKTFDGGAETWNVLYNQGGDNVELVAAGTTSSGNPAIASTATPSTVNFGNVHVGAVAPSQAISISNVQTATPADGLNGSIAVTSGAPGITANGSFSHLAAGAGPNTSLMVGMSTANAGGQSGVATISLASDGTTTGSVSSLASQTVNVSGGVYQYAQPSVASSVNVGNVRVGSTATGTIGVTNANISPSGYQEGLDAGYVSGSGTGGASASGTLTNLAAGSSGTLNAALTAGGAGAQSGTVTIGLTSDGTIDGLSSTTLASQNVTVQATGYREANPLLAPTAITLNARVGDAAPSAALTVTNSSPDQYTEGLAATLGSATGPFTNNGGAITNLAAQGVDSSTLKVGMSTGTSGSFTGTQTVNFTSNGMIDGAAAASVGTGTVNLTGNVYTTAVANVAPTTVSFGIVHVGDAVGTQALTVTNAAAGALNDVLTGGFASVTGPFTGSGSLSGLAAGSTDSSTLQLGMNTSTAGTYSGTATLGLLSHDGVLSDVAAVNGSTEVDLSGQVNYHATPTFELSGSGNTGTLTGSGEAFTLNLGTVRSGETLTDLIEFLNGAPGQADALGGSFTDAGTAPELTLEGFNPVSGLLDGQGITGEAELNTLGLTAGTSFTDVLSFAGTGSNASGFSEDLTASLTITGEIGSSTTPVPEPDTLLLWLSAGGLLILLRRVRSARAFRRMRHPEGEAA